MRVCPDAAFGRPWRAAVRHLVEAESARPAAVGVGVGERIAAAPPPMAEPNAESLRLRGEAGRQRRPVER